jgi:uncharacterized membrane protein
MPRRVAWLALLLLLAAAPAAAQRALVIESFDARVDVAADGTIVVEETIRPRYTGSWNGLYRTIPVQYKSPQGLNYTLRLDVESATDEAGRALRYESSRERHYRKLKIWVPGAVDATKTVKLRYRVTNSLRFFDEHDELYWNVTGDEWDVPIESAAAVVRLPDGASGIRATAFRGAYGSTEQAGTSVEEGRVVVRTTRGLAFREGLTVVVGWNPGVVDRPTAADKAADVVYGNLPLAIPPLVFAGMWWLWRARGRDPKLAPIVTRYEPPDQLTPAELGTLVDGKPDMRDITATIVDLAVRGYLHIDETKNEALFGLLSSKDYRFSLKKPRDSWAGLAAHERKLLSAMFGSTLETVDLSDLKDKFYKHLPGLRDDLYTMLVTRGFYTGRPDRVRVLYAAGGVLIGLAIAGAGAGAMAALGMQPAAAIVAGILSGLIIVAFGWLMPARTIRGTREVEHVLGFQEFLSRVEADRMERTIRTPEMFERYLPYAMALNVADNWAKAFEGIYQQSPNWYTGSDGAPAFRPTAFAGSLGRMSTQAASTMASAPRSSGGSGFSGGSSGGGSGGGGGGGF